MRNSPLRRALVLAVRKGGRLQDSLVFNGHHCLVLVGHVLLDFLICQENRRDSPLVGLLLCVLEGSRWLSE